MRQAKQIMTPFTLRRLKSQVLSQLPAKVSSTEHCQLTETQWTLYRGVVERSLRVNQGRHGECLQGNVVCWEIVASLCCGLVVREAAVWFHVQRVLPFTVPQTLCCPQYCSRWLSIDLLCYHATLNIVIY